jgi:polyhydroxyalkanoate synthesis regulator phasin
MSDNIQVDKGELSEQEKQEVFQDLLSGSKYVLSSHFLAIFLCPFA